jgi:hypothetical protein
VAVSEEEFLMRLPALFLLAISTAFGEPRIDNVLVKMVPPGATSLVGAHMDQIKNTEFYRKMLERQKLPQVDAFAKETGFDPRRDVREWLLASTPDGGVLLARGTFRVNQESYRNAQITRHGEYNIVGSNGAGFCILDSTLAVAGDLKSIVAALDEWKSGTHKAAQPLLAHAGEIDPQSQFWGVSTRFAEFIADHMPPTSSGLDFSKMFRGLKDTWFQADFTGNFKAEVHGSTATDQDAITLRDTAKGLIGFGRLSVPEDQKDMLALWDRITVTQAGQSVAIRADIPPPLIDRLVQMLGSTQAGRGRGRGLTPR